MGGLTDPKREEVESSTSVSLPDWAQPYLKSGLDTARNLAGVARSLPGTPLHAGMGDIREQGLNLIRGIASGGGALVEPAISYAKDVLGGEYLQPDELLAATKGAVNRAMPRVNSAFFGQGGGGGLRGAAMTEALGNIQSDAYQAERGRMGDVLRLAPTIESMAYSPGKALIDVGRQFEEDEQADIDEMFYRHQFAQEEPRTRNREYMQSLQTLLPFAGTEQQNVQEMLGPSPFDTMLGLAGTAASLSSGFGGGGGNMFSYDYTPISDFGLNPNMPMQWPSGSPL